MRIQFRRGTTALWTAATSILASGEPGIDTTTGVVKVGDGVTLWAALSSPGVNTSGQANVGQLFLFNRTGAPTTPVGGGILYVEAGALKYIGSSGTITPLGLA
jgi:hypothetical protein